MRISVFKTLLITSIFCKSIVLQATSPSPNAVLSGTYTLDNAGDIIDANTLMSQTGYFLYSGTMSLSNVTIQNFYTAGSTGSGGGAGLGGAIFVNTGATLNLNNVNLNANTAVGGDGGQGSTGGNLNSLLTATSNGSNGVAGDDATIGGAAENGGNGRNGYTGTPGGNASYGTGGAGGRGGNGSPGSAVTADTIKTAVEITQAGVKATIETAKASQDAEKATEEGAKATEEEAKATEEGAKATEETAKGVEETAKGTEAGVLAADEGAIAGELTAGAAAEVAAEAEITAASAATASAVEYAAEAVSAGVEATDLGAETATDAAEAATDTAEAATDTAEAATDTAEAATDTAEAATDTAQGVSDTALAASDVALQTAETVYLTAIQTTSYLTDGVAGNGGPGGNGAIGGVGSFGFGGGPGGDGGQGGDAVTHSVASGGLGGNGGNGGKGGFGGGGGKSGNAGAGGGNGTYMAINNGYLLGSPGNPGVPGFGGGTGSIGDGTENGTQGTGGSGYGGAIFVANGATLNINGPASFNNNAIKGGNSLNAGIAGATAGSDLFMMKTSTVNLNPEDGNVITFNGTIADDSAASIGNAVYAIGHGAGINIQSGVVAFNGSNTYTGPTNISGGVLQAVDGVGINFYSNINLSGGTLESNGTLNRFLGTGSDRIQMTGSGVSNGLSAANGDLKVTFNNNQKLTWGTGYFVPSTNTLLFGSPTATDNVTLTNPIDLNGGTRTILATANENNTNQGILSGVISNGSLIINDGSHNGTIVLAGDNIYTGTTHVQGGSLILQGSLLSPTITVDSGTTFTDSNGGLTSTTALTVNGTFNLETDDAIDTLAGNGTIDLIGATLSVNSGTFSGSIQSLPPLPRAIINSRIVEHNDIAEGLTKLTSGLLTLSGANTYLGPTNVQDGTLTLTGSLLSETINVALGAIFNDINAGIANNADVTIDGSLILSESQVIDALNGTGSVNIGPYILTVNEGNFEGTVSGTGDLVKASTDTFTLSGTVHTDLEVEEGTVILSGTFDGPTVIITSGATLNDTNGGLASTVAVINNGTFTLGMNDTISTLTNTGTVNGTGNTLTATTYTLNDGSLISSNLGTGTINTYGAVGLFGYSSAETLNVNTSSNLDLMAEDQLIHSTELTVEGVLNLIGTMSSNADTTVNTIAGDGTINLTNGTLSVSSGTFSGTIAGTNTDVGLTKLFLETLTLSGTNTYLGTTSVQAGILTLTGSLLSETIDVLLGATFNDVNAGLPDNAVATINGTLVLGGNQAIDTLNGIGSVDIGSSNLTVNQGDFEGTISGTGDLIKISNDTFTLSGIVHTDLEVEAGTLVLSGMLDGSNVTIASGATFNNSDGGIESNVTVTNNGILILGQADTISTLINSGTVDGTGETLTATNYTLNDGSIINSDLGTGTIDTYGLVKLYGSSAAETVNVHANSTLDLMGNQLLINSTTANIDGTLNLDGGNQTVYELNGSGDVFANAFQFIVTNGGTFSGQIHTTSAALINQGGTLMINNNIVNTLSLQVGSGSTIHLDGSETNLQTETVIVDPNGLLNVSNGAKATSNGDVTVKSNGVLNVNTGGSLATLENINLNADGSLVVNGPVSANSIITNTGSIITISDSSLLTYNLLTGNGTINTEGSVFINYGTIRGFINIIGDFLNFGMLSPGNSPGLTTITGNFTETSTLHIQLETPTPILGYDQIQVSGSVTLFPSSILDVEVLGSTLPATGNIYQIIANSAGGPTKINGLFGSVEFDDGSGNPIENAAVLFDVANGQLIATGLNADGSQFTDLASNKNQYEAASAIYTVAQLAPNQINSATPAGLFARQIVTLGDPATNLNYFTPQFYGATADYAFVGDRAFVSTVWNRVSPFRAPPNKRCSDKTEYAGFVGFLDNTLHDRNQAHIHRRDFYIGGDLTAKDDSSFGVAISRTLGNITSKLGGSKAEGYNSLFYGRKNWGSNFTSFATFGYSGIEYSARRKTLNGYVHGDDFSSTWTASIGGQYKGYAYRCLSFAPRLDLVYSHANVYGFKEKGAIDALNNRGYHADLFTGELGISALLSGTFLDHQYNVELLGGVEQAFVSHKGKLNLDVVSSPEIAYGIDFSNKGLTRATYGVNFGYDLSENTTLNFGYEGESGTAGDQQFDIALRVKW